MEGQRKDIDKVWYDAGMKICPRAIVVTVLCSCAAGQPSEAPPQPVLVESEPVRDPTAEPRVVENQPEQRDTPPQDLGDRDGDRVGDDKDLCPDDPEDADGFEDEDGCPDADNDRDGIPDVNDQCPNEPEVFDGRRDDDGCPD